MNIVFTKHAEEMMEERKITQDEVEITIKSPGRLYKKDRKYYASKNIIRELLK